MSEPKRYFSNRLRAAFLLGIAALAIGQPAKCSMAANGFPQDGAGYEWNSVTWVPQDAADRQPKPWKNANIWSVPWKCEKCGEQHTSLTLSGEVDVDYTNLRTGRRGSRRVKVWANVQEQDTREIPNAMDVFLQRDGIRIDAIDTENEMAGLKTLKSVYRENRQHQHLDDAKPFVHNGLLYRLGKWKPGTLSVITLKCACHVCDYDGPPIQLLVGTIQNSWVESVKAPHTGKKAWTNEELPHVYSMIGPKDIQTIPDPIEVLKERGNYNSYVLDVKTLREEWEKAHRD